MSLEFLVGNVLLSGHLSDLGNVSLNILDPFARVASALLASGLVSSRSLLTNSFLSGFSPFLVHPTGSLTGESGVRVNQIKSLAVSERISGLLVVQNAILL